MPDERGEGVREDGRQGRGGADEEALRVGEAHGAVQLQELHVKHEEADHIEMSEMG